MLTAHEIATLLLLLNAPVEVMAATPDVAALQEVGLVQLVESEKGEAMFALTVEGNAVLRVLGAGNAGFIPAASQCLCSRMHCCCPR
jgi:hypothetical protein